MVTKDHRITWLVRTEIPLLDNGRLDLRLDVAPDPEAAAILARMASRNDPAHGLEALRAAVAPRPSTRPAPCTSRSIGCGRSFSSICARSGRMPPPTSPHMDRSLRSRVFTYGPKLARGLNDTLTPVRRHAKAVAPGGLAPAPPARSGRFGAYIERFTAARAPQPENPVPHGPTNSGKTYAALQHLTAAETGAYLAPLRLLALENYETLRERGLRAGMITGEEVLGEANRPTPPAPSRPPT